MRFIRGNLTFRRITDGSFNSSRDTVTWIRCVHPKQFNGWSCKVDNFHCRGLIVKCNPRCKHWKNDDYKKSHQTFHSHLCKYNQFQSQKCTMSLNEMPKMFTLCWKFDDDCCWKKCCAFSRADTDARIPLGIPFIFPRLFYFTIPNHTLHSSSLHPSRCLVVFHCVALSNMQTVDSAVSNVDASAKILLKTVAQRLLPSIAPNKSSLEWSEVLVSWFHHPE